MVSAHNHDYDVLAIVLLGEKIWHLIESGEYQKSVLESHTEVIEVINGILECTEPPHQIRKQEIQQHAKKSQVVSEGKHQHHQDLHLVTHLTLWDKAKHNEALHQTLWD